MSNEQSTAERYSAALAAQTGADQAEGRWLVQRRHASGLYRDELATNSAVLAEHGFRQSTDHRVIDTRIKDVAADYPRASHDAKPGEAEYSMRSQLKMALNAEQADQARAGQAGAVESAPGRAAALAAAVKASEPYTGAAERADAWQQQQERDRADQVERYDDAPAATKRTSAPAQNAALAFLQAKTADDRRDAVRQHPQLANAFALEAANRAKVSDALSPQARQAYESKMRDNIAKGIAEGRPLRQVEIRDTGAREVVQRQDRDQGRTR